MVGDPFVRAGCLEQQILATIVG
ncbi:MAG: hypothetical protein FD129_1585, partial [bacterium]